MCLFERRWSGRIPVLWVGYGVGFIFWEGGSRAGPSGLPLLLHRQWAKGQCCSPWARASCLPQRLSPWALLSSSHKFFGGSRLVVWLLPDSRLVAQRESPGPMHISSFHSLPPDICFFCLIQLCPGVGIFAQSWSVGRERSGTLYSRLP